MRKITLIIMILSMAFLTTAISYAQNAPHRARMYPPIEEGWRLTESTVSSSGFDNETWRYSHKFTYEYGSDFPQKPDRINRNLFDYNGKHGWYINRSYFITYDSGGRLLHVDAERYPNKYNQCYYDDHGRLTQVDISWYYGLKTLTMTYFVDEIRVQDNERNKTIFTVNDDWEIVSQKVFVLTNLNEWEEKYTEEYQYHPQNSGGFREFQDWLAYFLANMHLNSLEVPGLCTQKLRGRYDGDDFLLNTKTTWDYDDTPRAVESNIYQWMDDHWDLTDVCEYEYNDDGLLLFELHKRDNGNDEMTYYSKTEYSYETYASIQDENESPALALEISAYPSPFCHSITITAKSAEPIEAEIAIYNLKGQKVRRLSSDAKAKAIWDGRDDSGKELPAGIYFVAVKHKHQSHIKKISKIH